MTKIVINKCYGGFSLSNEAMSRYIELKGLTTYPEKSEYGRTSHYLSKEKNSKGYREYIYDGDIERDDPFLVQVVEELGDKADGTHASLKIIDIPEGISWHLDYYDGIETIHESHSSWG